MAHGGFYGARPMGANPLNPYLPLAIVLLVSGGLGAVIIGLASVLGPKRPAGFRPEMWECGANPVGDARQRFAVKFYVVALLFIVFDVETVFLYPWAVNFLALGWFGYVEMAIFAATLVAGLVYVWKKGALSWET